MLNYQALLDAIEQNKIKPVHEAIVSHLSQYPEDHVAYYVLAILNIKLRNIAKAIAILDKCLSIQPCSKYTVEKAKLLLFSNQPLQAKAILDAITPESTLVAVELDTIANMHLRLSQFASANVFFERAYNAASDNPNISLNFAINEKMRGNVEKAHSILVKLCKKHPAFIRAQVALSELSDSTSSQERIGELEKLLTQSSTIPQAQYDLYHALALEFEKLGELDSAWHCFNLSKVAVESLIGFDNATYVRFIEELKGATNTPIQFEAFDDIEPIFVVGVPRSGTSLTEQLLSHSDHFKALGELATFPQCLGVNNNLIQTLEALKQEYITGEACRRYREMYLSLSQGKRGIDKFPFNYLFVDILAKAFPKASFVFVHRDCKNSAIANFRQHYQPNSPFHHYSFNFEHCQLVTELADSLRLHFTNKHQQVFDLSYEKLVHNPSEVLTDLCHFLNADFDPEMLNFHQKNYYSATASKLQLRKPLNQDGLSRYNGYIKLIGGKN
ncbi:tetratricopeptide repeat-containing sulfotransferase family protein [Pseudoalteromonas xiamenensis]|uniref:Sulfotransferase n=1 Tax=Pseudoalteromonas xiamenensis TaxID=882626 RepID=A0A975DGG9_9GAMM|nr:sulfotransferase [Pseudoalteromonas xiamenensis]QTH71416.1 sulfotransferase [Pseudoalteromonas xiamenensis]